MHSEYDYSAERRAYSARPRRKRSPEECARASQISKELWTRPEFRKRMAQIAVERWTPELRERLSKATTDRVLAGEMGKHRFKFFDYKTAQGLDIKLHGTYELRVGKALDIHGYQWEKNRDAFVYQDEQGHRRRYTPDFKITEGSSVFYVEVKGMFPVEDVLKMYAVLLVLPRKLFVLCIDGIKELERGENPFVQQRELMEVAHAEIAKFCP